MDDQKRREQAEALLKILKLGREEIRRGKYFMAEEIFAKLNAMDETEFKKAEISRVVQVWSFIWMGTCEGVFQCVKMIIS